MVLSRKGYTYFCLGFKPRECGAEMATGTSKRGFGLMTLEKRQEIARKGGRAAHERGTAHKFTSTEAREAGRKGGEAVSGDRSHMAAIGRLGGKKSSRLRGSTTPTAKTDGAGPGNGIPEVPAT